MRKSDRCFPRYRKCLRNNEGEGEAYQELLFGRAEDVTYWLVTGDVDGDGFPDIAVANSDGVNQVFLSKPTR